VDSIKSLPIFWTKVRIPTLVIVMTEHSTLEELVRQAMDGDVQAFGILYDRTVRLVRAVAMDAGPDSSDDITHEAYLRAYRNLKNLRDPSKFPAWLVGITRMIVRESRKVRRFAPLTAEIPVVSSENPLDGDTEELLRAIARLPEEERLAIKFFFLNERSIEETARLLERSRSGTYSVLQNAKARLALWLRECGVDR
jgi:RNA polymerase sigma-70 factor (ECF subfamily)